MARIRILHLYSQVLDLYGDYRNVDAICQRIKESGLEVEVDRPELWDDLVLDGYDLVYVGHDGRSRACRCHPRRSKLGDVWLGLTTGFRRWRCPPRT